MTPFLLIMLIPVALTMYSFHKAESLDTDEIEVDKTPSKYSQWVDNKLKQEELKTSLLEKDLAKWKVQRNQSSHDWIAEHDRKQNARFMNDSKAV